MSYKKKISTATLCSLTLLLTSCGTLDRGISKSPTYKGVDRDISELSDPYYWYSTLLIGPLFSIISLPIDAGMDTILYPYDKWQDDKKTAPLREYTTQVDSVSIIGVNLTDGFDFKYYVANQKQGYKNTSVTDYAVKPSALDKITEAQPIDIYKKKTTDHNLIVQWTVKQVIKQNTTQGGYEEEQFTNVTRYVMPPAITLDTKLLVVLFMPCNQVTIAPAQQFTIQNVKEIIGLPEVQETYKQLQNKQLNRQCPSSNNN